MRIKLTYKSGNNGQAQASSKIFKRVNWDKEWYSAHIDLHIDSLQIKENMMVRAAIEQATLKLCEILNSSMDTGNTSSVKNSKANIECLETSPEILQHK